MWAAWAAVGVVILGCFSLSDHTGGKRTLSIAGPCIAGFKCSPGSKSPNDLQSMCLAGQYSIAEAGRCDNCTAGKVLSAQFDVDDISRVSQGVLLGFGVHCYPPTGYYGSQPALGSPTCSGQCQVRPACTADSLQSSSFVSVSQGPTHSLCLPLGCTHPCVSPPGWIFLPKWLHVCNTHQVSPGCSVPHWLCERQLSLRVRQVQLGGS